MAHWMLEDVTDSEWHGMHLQQQILTKVERTCPAAIHAARMSTVRAACTVVVIRQFH